MALGVGANTAIFILIDQVLLRKLPVKVMLYQRSAHNGSNTGDRMQSYPMTIVGVSAPGFAGIDLARSPQIRVPILMKPVMVSDWPGSTTRHCETTSRPL